MAAVCHQCGAAGGPEDRFCARCGAATRGSANGPADPLLGRTVGGAYTLHELIGVGGMGRVYRAEQTALGRTVAVKVIHPHLLGDDRIVARFYNEARAASRLNHPNSVGIIDFGRTDDGILYLAMEHLQGKDLALVLHEEGPLPMRRVCRLLDGVLGALGEAHALGVVHRDLKPENIIVRRFRTGGDLVKVVDFGLATIVSGEGMTAVTSAGMVCGTPDYMPPEQGRGDPVDGRGDVYALGVVLFELLTDRLPFEDETPTRVVLRHINDPIPDPAAVAPGRGIPPALCAVVMRAMAKRAEDRYQSAEEMQEALRAAAEMVQASERPDVTCAACGERSAAGMRFCGSCGARIMPSSARLRSGPMAAVAYRPPGTGDRALIGREDELARAGRLREEAAAGLRWLHVTGEPGVGKTRLIAELVETATAGGDVVVGTGPHPSRAPVAYHAVRALVTTLLQVQDEDLAAMADDAQLFPSPLGRAGLAELVEPRGLEGLDGQSRVGAVAHAVAGVLRAAAARSGSGRLVAVVDDLEACDALGRRVILELPDLLADAPILLITSGPSGLALDGAEELPLMGLDLNQAGKFLSYRDDDGRRSTVVSNQFMLPLYLEQVEALTGQGGDLVPPRLADAVAQRIDRLDVASRRVLQALSVLGDRCSLEELRSMLGEENDLGALEHLHTQRLVRVSGEEVEVGHPFLRELVHASIPAEARRGLHERALRSTTARGAPLEVRAEHSFRGAAPMAALMLLERMGNLSSRRGDAVAAVLAYRRALELARREMLETGDPMLEGAILTFSRKLGEALERSGDVVGAEGVLREALDLAAPASGERARMLLALGRVASRRGRPRDAVRQLGMALELVSGGGDPATEARIQLALGRARRLDDDLEGAVLAYTKALDHGALPVEEALAAHRELAEVLIQRDEIADARACLERARDLATEQGLGAVTAAVVGALGQLAEATGDRERATGCFRDAARLAAEAGDADAHVRWRRAADSLAAPRMAAG